MDSTIALSGLLWGPIAGAVIVMSGGAYALLFALGRQRQSMALSLLSVLSFILLIAATLLLAHALNLTGFWLLVCAVMLIGYWFAPRVIWWLCVGTHVETRIRS